MPTFHPAYLLREPDRKRDAWADLKLVSTGKVDLPNLTGLTTDQARRTLLELNLVLNLTYEESTQPKDTVIRQEPAAGVVDQRSAVSVVAAKEAARIPIIAIDL